MLMCQYFIFTYISVNSFTALTFLNANLSLSCTVFRIYLSVKNDQEMLIFKLHVYLKMYFLHNINYLKKTYNALKTIKEDRQFENRLLPFKILFLIFQFFKYKMYPLQTYYPHGPVSAK